MTEEFISPYDRFSIESAEQYIQTVVLVDDRIFVDGPRATAKLNVRRPRPMGRKPATSRTESSRDTDANEKKDKVETEIPSDASFRAVQGSFAKKRIICSLYQPDNDASFDDESEVYGLCSSADVTIVDWDLGDSSGGRATKLVGNLLEHSQAKIPHQLRLVLIYTQNENLKKVARTISDDFARQRQLTVDSESEQLVIKTKCARVVVLGKPLRGRQTSSLINRVPETELAERTIEEFSRLAAGLMQGIVLRGIAKLRDNNGRILARFRRELDAAFLSHRTLLLPDEAFEQMIPILTDELNSVLEDTMGQHPLGSQSCVEEILRDWCDRNWRKNEQAKLNIGLGNNEKTFVKDAICNGPDLKGDYSGYPDNIIGSLRDDRQSRSPIWKNGKCESLAEFLIGHCDDNRCQERLSALMSQRIKYGDTYRSLHLGVIVREMATKGRFLLCLQPVCDSVRIESESRPFVFCTLTQPNKNSKITHCVIDANGDVVKLLYKPKIPFVVVKIFESDSETVIASKDECNRFVFKDVDNNRYEWIAELKTEHAQRAAEQFGRELTRVGLTESEWLRLKAR